MTKEADSWEPTYSFGLGSTMRQNKFKLKLKHNINHTYIFGSVMLADGVNSKQARIRVVGIEGRSLQQSKTDPYKESIVKSFLR